jgi:hypothetical protein
MQFDKTGLETYITDQEVESKLGVWLPPFPGDRRFKVLRAGGSNKKFARAFQQMLRPYRKQLNKDMLDPDVADRLLREAYAQHIVVDWKNINDADGNPVPCTPDNVLDFFNAFPEIFSEISGYAQEMGTFSAEYLEEAKETLGET